MGTPLTVESYSSFGRRLAAAILDGLILMIPMALVSRMIPMVGWLVVYFFYAPILESSEIRATLGKHLMGIQVCDLQGRRISLRAAIIRNLLKLISSALLFVGHVFALFTERRQALHDLFADTLVVYGRSERSIADAWTASLRELFGPGQSTHYSAQVVEELERLQALRERGALTEEEFQAQKKRVLGGR